MFTRLFNFLTAKGRHAVTGKSSPVTNAVDPDFARLNEVSPLKKMSSQLQGALKNDETTLEENTLSTSVVRREAVLNNNQKVAGYYFTLTHGVNDRAHNISERIQRLYDEVLIGNILGMDIQRLLGHRLAFIPISPYSLKCQLIEQLPRKGVVLVLNTLAELSHEDTRENAEYLARLVTLKNSGFRFGLEGDVTLPGLQPFLDLAEFVFIDIGANDIPTIKSHIDVINKQASNKSLVATNIRLLDEFHVCAKLPFHFAQGSFVSSREEWVVPAINTGRIKILRLLNLIRQDADNSELVEIFKQDPALSFKFLKYINSVGYGLVNKVHSIEQALPVLGHHNLYRWLTLILFTSGDENSLDWALMENALIRARLAELYASDSLSASELDELFVAGIFSLLDILLQMPMEKVLDQISLPPLVVEALLYKRGKYAPYLELALACEESDQDRIVDLSSLIGLDLIQVTAHQANALIWAVEASE